MCARIKETPTKTIIINKLQPRNRTLACLRLADYSIEIETDNFGLDFDHMERFSRL